MTGGFSIVGIVEEISVGGCLLRSLLNFDEGHEFHMSLNLAGIEINVGARVIHQRRESSDAVRCGIKFTAVEPVDLRCVESYVSSKVCAVA